MINENLFTSYSRQLRTLIWSSKSKLRLHVSSIIAKFGIPQGSHIGPIILIIDIAQVIRRTSGSFQDSLMN